MGIKLQIARLMERLTNTHIYRTLPPGVDAFSDIERYLPNFRCQIVFDVGANVGQSAATFREQFPQCSIYCYEPVAANFQLLTQNTRHMSNVHCFQIAVGRSEGRGNMSHSGGTMAQLQVSSANAASDTQANDVAIETIDGQCHSQGIKHIDYLKIDTEGHDLAVLEGAEAMLAAQQVDLIEVEVGMNSGNTHHVPFHAIQSFLESRQYYLFGIYEQMREWLTNQPHLRRCNCVFVSKEMIDANPTR